jgi:hypothetical protein
MEACPALRIEPALRMGIGLAKSPASSTNNKSQGI